VSGSFELSPQTQRLVLDQPFVLESGITLPSLKLAYRTWGTLSPNRDNVIVVCHALTGSADADAWWTPLFGAGRVLDPTQDFIICSNVLGSCYGSTGPTSLAEDGNHWGARFPAITVRDQVGAQIRLADALGVRSIRFVIGGSMGGFHALEWALLDPQRVEAVVSIASSGRHSPWSLAWSEAQRLALAADPLFDSGNYTLAAPPRAGLAAARAIAMISYRSAHSLEHRFGRQNGREKFAQHAADPDDFAVNGWLRHHGRALVERFDANSYLRLLGALDSHDLGRGRGSYEAAIRSIRQPVLVGSIHSDALYVPREQHELLALLPHGELLGIDSHEGHDGFLINAVDYEPQIRRFIQTLPRQPRLKPKVEPVVQTIRPLRYAW
jgi:homoserine O-acetyltransferase